MSDPVKIILIINGQEIDYSSDVGFMHFAFNLILEE